MKGEVFTKGHKNNLLGNLDTMCDRLVNGDLSNNTHQYAINTLAYTYRNILKRMGNYQCTMSDEKVVIKEILETLEFYGFDKDEVWDLV
jgi:hypothetical protein